MKIIKDMIVDFWPSDLLITGETATGSYFKKLSQVEGEINESGALNI